MSTAIRTYGECRYDITIFQDAMHIETPKAQREVMGLQVGPLLVLESCFICLVSKILAWQAELDKRIPLPRRIIGTLVYSD